jgi:hypothetical protein
MVILILAEQVAPGMQVEAATMDAAPLRVEVVVALEDRGRQHKRMMLVTAARVLNRPYPVPPNIMAAAAAAVAAAVATLAMED